MAKYDWSKFGLHIPEIMLPKEGTDYFKWAVVACDQYTSEPEYWEKVEEIDGDAHDAALKCVENGLLIITAKNLLRMLPPLVITQEEIDEAVKILEKTLKEIN